jgi:predicted  nucleic acid-binding Zn-ribbon protein
MREFQSLEDLLDLQSLDLQLDHLIEERSSLSELQAYRAAHEQAEAIAAQLADLDEQLRTVELDLDKASGELELAETKVQQQERRLFAGGMSAKETENMRRDVEMLRRQVSELEDLVLELLDERERLEGERTEVAKRLEAARDEEQRLSVIIKEAWAKIDAEIARKEERKSAVVELVPEELLELYERLRIRKEGVAVGRLDETWICGGCHLKLSAAERQEALSEEPPRCPHCRRILVP